MAPFDWKYVFEYLPRLLPFIPVTLEIWILCILCGIVIGVLFTIIRIKHIPVLTQIIRVLISIVRGLPAITQLFLFYYGLPQLLLLIGIDITNVSGMVFVVLAYGLSQGASLSENLRASFASVGKGQLDAAYSIGMTGALAYRRVMIPQAMVVALPNFANICIGALKGTSLAFSVGVIELMTRAQQLSTNTMHYMESYVSLAIIYYGLYLILRIFFNRAEKKVAFENAG